jgi:hypothetical protein
MFLVHDNGRQGSESSLRFQLSHGRGCMRPTCQTTKLSHRLPHTVSLQVDCLFHCTYLRSQLFWDNGCSAGKDACRRTDASPHTDTSFDDIAGSFARIGYKCRKISPTLHRHGTDLPPPARPTSQTGTGPAYSQVARAHYKDYEPSRHHPKKDVCAFQSED